MMMRAPTITVLIALWSGGALGTPAQPVQIEGGEFKLPVLFGERTHSTVEPFLLDATQVTNAGFAAFVADHPRWRRDRAPSMFRDAGYLEHWATPVEPGTARLELPVTHVSWFASNAYCEARGGRLPTMDEWEYSAAANQAIDGDAYAAAIFTFYANPGANLRQVALTEPGVLGVFDMHGLVLEWVEDFQLVVQSEGEAGLAGGGCGDTARFLAENDQAHYATFLRYQSRSNYTPRTTTSTLGFRCAYDMEKPR
jgi:formylglycine-generating enzyme required for sulfatase activity